MTAYLLGVLTLPALYVVGALVRDTAHLWRTVRRYGGEDVRTLTLGGRAAQRALQAVPRALHLSPTKDAR